MKVEHGVMIVKNGKGWGKVYSDGRSTQYGWTRMEDADISDPRYLRKPTDATYAESPYIRELESASVVKVERTTTVKVLPPG